MATVELGAQLPAWRWDLDLGELRDWAQGVEAIGYDWLGITDHVLYAYDLPDRPAGRYVGAVIQHEPLTFLAAVAGWTSRVALTTSVIVAPQREPVLLAKQAAEVDWLSGGRLRLGVGVGWQESEYAALGMSFARRGSAMEEAVALMRACWREEPIDYEGDGRTLRAMSMLPKPVSPGGPPILFGGLHERALDRAARLGDGWIAMTAFQPDQAADLAERLRTKLRERGRAPETFALQATTPLTDDTAALTEILRAYLQAGFTRLGLHLPSFDPAEKISVDAYLRRLEAVWREVWPAAQAG